MYFLLGMLSSVQRISTCLRATSFTEISYKLPSRSRQLYSIHFVKANFGVMAKQKVFVTRSDYPQNGIDLLQNK